MLKNNMMKIVAVASLLAVMLSGTALANKALTTNENSGGMAPAQKHAAPIAGSIPGTVGTIGGGAGSEKAGNGNAAADTDIRGTITQVMKGTKPDPAAKGKLNHDTSVSDNGNVSSAQQGDDIRMILVETEQDGNNVSSYDKALTRITDETKIFKLENGVLVSASAADLKVGVAVEVVFTGPIAESYPIQTDAGVIVILE